MPGHGSWTILLKAATSGVPDVVATFLHMRPNVEARDDHGWNALHYAVAYSDIPYPRDPPPENRAEVVRLLLAAGAELNARTNAGETPLALSKAYGDATTALIKAGATR